MDLSQCFYLGYISRVIGSKGRCEIKLDVDQPSDYKKLESVLILMNSKDLTPVPFFIQRTESLYKNELKVDLVLNQAIPESSSLKGKQVYLPLASLKPLSGTSFYYHEVIDYTVEDKSLGNIGKVQEIYDLPVNPVLSVISDGNEILIPIRDEIVLNVDRKKKIIEINAPDGLIDLYRE